MSLIRKVEEAQQTGRLDYKWDVRRYLYEKKHRARGGDLVFLEDVVSPFAYLNKHRDVIADDKSLFAICQLCTGVDHVIDVEQRDERLFYLARLFNEMTQSARSIHMCYDCGTVARGVFFQLIKAYRGSLHLFPKEIERFRDEYYMDRHKGIAGINVLARRLHSVKQNSLFMCALQLGDDFGHIYVIEKIYVDGKPRFRLFQSCLNAYLLVDYLECMDYCRGSSVGIDVDQHLSALRRMIGTQEWGPTEIDLFIEWYKFYPSSGWLKSEAKLFTSTYIVF
jgi:hypothetical protein